MILADENLNIRLITDLREAGYEVLSVYEQFRGMLRPHLAAISPLGS